MRSRSRWAGLLVTALLLSGAATAQVTRPLYDSATVSFAHSLPAGISHKTAQQAVITFQKIGEGKPIDKTDSLFLEQWMPGYLHHDPAVAAPRRPPARLQPLKAKSHSL